MEMIYKRMKNNLEILKLNNTKLIIDNYLEIALKEKKSVIEILDYLFEEERKSKIKRASEIQIQMAGFPYRKELSEFDFSFQPSINKETIKDLSTLRFISNKENVVFLGTPGVGKTHLAISMGIIAAQNKIKPYYINCNDLIVQLKKAYFENKLAQKIKQYAKFKLLIIDEIGYLPMDIDGANLFFQLIAKRYEKSSTIFTSNRSFSNWGEIFSDTTIAAAILDRILHHCTVINIQGESYRLKERKEELKNKRMNSINTLFD